VRERARHVAYAGGWKKLEPLWDAVIRAKRVTRMLPSLESILEGFGRYKPARPQRAPVPMTKPAQGSDQSRWPAGAGG
jgi:hypothetical protein